MSQFQKQPPEMFYRKSCFLKFRNIHRKTPVFESPFNRFADFKKNCNFLKKGLQHRKTPVLESHFKKVAGLEARKSMKRKLQHRCFPMNIAKFLKTAFSVEHLWWLLLKLRHFLVCDV